MKKYIATFMLGIGILTGCTSDAIDLDPKDSIPYNVAFETAVTMLPKADIIREMTNDVVIRSELLLPSREI